MENKNKNNINNTTKFSRYNKLPNVKKDNYSIAMFYTKAMINKCQNNNDGGDSGDGEDGGDFEDGENEDDHGDGEDGEDREDGEDGEDGED